MIGRTTTRIIGATTIVGASFWATLLVTPASPQSEQLAPEPFVPWLMKLFEPTASVETQSESPNLPVPRPRPVQQQKLAAATQGTAASAHMHEQTRPREQTMQQMPKFLLGPTMVPPDEPLIQRQPARTAMPEPIQQGPKF